jgi:hypothetical protein
VHVPRVVDVSGSAESHARGRYCKSAAPPRTECLKLTDQRWNVGMPAPRGGDRPHSTSLPGRPQYLRCCRLQALMRVRRCGTPTSEATPTACAAPCRGPLYIRTSGVTNVPAAPWATSAGKGPRPMIGTRSVRAPLNSSAIWSRIMNAARRHLLPGNRL